MRAFWRWLAKPVVSVADAVLIATAILAGDAMRLGWHLPWPAVLAIVWGATIAAVFGVGFVKGFARSALYDARRWKARTRTRRDAPGTPPRLSWEHVPDSGAGGVWVARGHLR